MSANLDTTEATADAADSGTPRPKFSIILNVYNGEDYLREALDSVFAQTCRDFELIFWDDHSTDGSKAILDSYPPDERVRYFFAPERVPLGKAREEAIRLARGEWLAFIDHDDVWTADKLEKQARVIDTWTGPELAIVYGRAMKFNARDLVIDYDRWHEFSDMPQGDIFDELFVVSCFICQSAVCLRTEPTQAIGAFPPEFECSPDYFMYTELASRFAAACTQDIVCWYRLHDKAMSEERYIQMQGEMLQILERWKHRLDAPTYRRRRRIHNTMWGLREVVSGSAPLAGIRRILANGSLPYLLARPFVKGMRGLRRSWLRAREGTPTKPVFG